MSEHNTTVITGEPQPGSLEGAALYLAATRPPFLIAGALPVFIGLGAAWYVGHVFNLILAILTVLGAVIAHAGINVFNDYYDHLNGTDENNTDRIFPFTGGSRFIQNGLISPEECRNFALFLFALTTVIGLILTYLSGPELILIGFAGLLIGWAYSAPPLALNSHGLGEICVGLGFGTLIPLGTFYTQTSQFALEPLLIGIPYGLLTANLLVINQFPDRSADMAAGKHHLVVRMPIQAGRWLYLMIAGLAYVLLPIFVLNNLLPGLVLLGMIAAPLSLYAAMSLIWYANQPSKLAQSIKLTIMAMILMGISSSLALLLA
jgi:1,4-dihydroxy-2-naphthoate octaprenyltransferase